MEESDSPEKPALTAEQEAELLKEERRKKREAILQKHGGGSSAPKRELPASSESDLPPPKKMPYSPSSPPTKSSSSSSTHPTKSPASSSSSSSSSSSTPRAAASASLKEEDEFDMFSADAPPPPAALAQTASLKSTVNPERPFTDSQGYFNPPAATILSNYCVRGFAGQGIFSTVFMCSDIRNNTVVAIKAIRSNDAMRRAAQKEISILQDITKKAQDKKYNDYVIRLLDTFEHDDHICLVFEEMNMDLRTTMHKFGRNTGLNLVGVRRYGKQLFSALRTLERLGIVHADLKPDNILVSLDLKTAKLADFGSAFRISEPSTPTPYLVSRYYRAPEIILGLETGPKIDVWALATVLYEIFSSKVLFPGKTNNDMLKLFQQHCGRFPNKILKHHIRVFETTLELEPHFDENLKFKRHDPDPVDPNAHLIRKLVMVPEHPEIEFVDLLKQAPSSGGGDDPRGETDFADLLKLCCQLDADKRMSVSEALLHPFLSPERRVERKVPSQAKMFQKHKKETGEGRKF